MFLDDKRRRGIRPRHHGDRPTRAGKLLVEVDVKRPQRRAWEARCRVRIPTISMFLLLRLLCSFFVFFIFSFL